MSFSINENRYLLDSQNIVEAIRVIDVKSMPWVPSYLIGSTTLRGQILPVIDMKRFFNNNSYINENKEIVDNYIAVDYEKIHVIFKVGKILGTVDESECISQSELSHSDSEFFDKVLLYQNNLYIKINIDSVFAKIREDLRKSYQEFSSESRNLLEPSVVKDLKEKNIQLSIEENYITGTVRQYRPKIAKKTAHVSKKETGIIFVSNGLNFLVRSDDVVEIIEKEYFDEVANSNEFVLGVLNYRGKIISIIRLDRIIDETNYTADFLNDESNQSKVIILNIDGNNFGLMVDQTKNITSFTKKEIHSIIKSEGRTSADYLLEGVIVKSEEIIFILNLRFIYSNLITKKGTAQFIENSLLFENRPEATKIIKSTPREEYLLFSVSDKLYSIKTSALAQIVDQRYIVHKNYPVKELLGAVALKKIMPLFDFGLIIDNTPCNINSGRSEVLILENNDLTFGFLVEKVLDKVVLENYLDLQEFFSNQDDIIKNGINGLFNFNNEIVIDLDPSVILKHSYEVIKSEMKLDLKVEEFESTLEEGEIVLLNTIKEEYSELERLLSQRFDSSRHDFLVFKSHEKFFAIDVENVGTVYLDFEIKKLVNAPEFYLGQAYIEGQASNMVFDLVASILNTKESSSFGPEFLFTFTSNDHSIFIPVENIYGVYTFYEEEFNSNKLIDLKLESDLLSGNYVKVEKISDPVHILDQNKLLELLRTKNTNLEKKVRDTK
ncbi:MAG: chemotaxis protein CheW [Candidatus Hodarchaeales archaeon]